MGDIYRQVYGGKHYLMGIALSNLASVRMEAGRADDAERLLREAVTIYETTLAPDHVNTAVGRIKLGRALLRQGRHTDAETSILTGYDVLVKQANPSVSFLRAAREDLVQIYDALQRTQEAQRFREELARAGGS
jgi:serine/threonine-protein kinase